MTRRPERLTVWAVVADQEDQPDNPAITRYEVTAVALITAETIGDAVAAMVAQVGELA